MERKSRRKSRSQISVESEDHPGNYSDAKDTDDESADGRVTNQSIGAVRSGGDMNSASSISTSILDDAEELKDLKTKLVQYEERNSAMESKIQELNTALSNEKSKNAKLERKLQFVKDNQEVFMKLKEAYINMKYNEAAGRKMIEVREKGIQTWEGILCKACIDAEELRRQMNSVKETYQDAFVIDKIQLLQITNTMKYLKDLVTRREKSWGENLERENRLRSQLSLVESENAVLRSIAKDLPAETEDLQVTADDMGDVNKAEVVQLKKIIVKFEKRFKEIDPGHDDNIKPALNEKEKKIIQQIMTKYQHAKVQKNISIRSRSHSKDFKKSRGFDNSRSPSTAEHYSQQNTTNDAAFMMMECLFDDDH